MQPERRKAIAARYLVLMFPSCFCCSDMAIGHSFSFRLRRCCKWVAYEKTIHADIRCDMNGIRRIQPKSRVNRIRHAAAPDAEREQTLRGNGMRALVRVRRCRD